MRECILSQLRTIAETEQIKIVYASESGSRGWGFPSADSDYDVRFLYVRPVEWYLSIDVEKKPDTVELPITDELDIAGWDIRKALNLLRKSNAPLLEWLTSPVVYLDTFGVAAAMRTLAQQHHSPIACFWHYFNMAAKNYHADLTGEQVNVKRYLYVLRPLFAAIWIERDLGMVPMAFDILLNRIGDDQALRENIQQLIAEKRSGREAEQRSRIPVIDAFIQREISRLEQNAAIPPARHFPVDELNALFRTSLENINNDSHRDTEAQRNYKDNR